jgi:ubiquinone/menaquinone biosynthesis C-methylase UbiE
MDPRQRFSSRVQDYVKYRPTYPRQIVEFLGTACGFTSESIVADVGSGTGIVSELLLKNGNPVLAIEPNNDMRQAAEEALKNYPRFTSVPGSAEATTLPDHCCDFVIAAQAFHWFDQKLARAEFVRILRPQGWATLVWNERRLSSTPFLEDYEQLLLNLGVDYNQVRHENVESDIAGFYSPETFQLAVFENLQELDLEGLRGRFFSSSYTPEPGHPNFEPLRKELDDVFHEHQVHGKVTIEYDTKLYYGHLPQVLGQQLR